MVTICFYVTAKTHFEFLKLILAKYMIGLNDRNSLVDVQKT